MMIFFKMTYYYFHFSSRQVVFNAIKTLTQKAEKFVRDKKAREDDKIWIGKKLTEGNFWKIRDISALPPTPTKESTPLSPKRPVDDLDLGRGKRSKVQRTPCQNAGCTDDDCTSTEHHSSSPTFKVSQNFKTF